MASLLGGRRRASRTLVATCDKRALRLERLEDRCLLANDAAVAINQFALDLYEHMQNEEGNLFFSPLSISTAMGMAFAGAAGQTADEIAQVFHFGDSADIHSSFSELLASFAARTGEDPPPPPVFGDFPAWQFDGPAPYWWPQFPLNPASGIDFSQWGYQGAPPPASWPQSPLVEDPLWPFDATQPYWWPRPTNPPFDYQIDVANGVWPDDDIALRSDYVDLLTSYYEPHFEAVDYANPTLAEQTINDWVSDRTRERIQDLVKGTGPNTVLVLTNTVFFNAAWSAPFDPRYTTAGQFNKSDGTSVDADLMYTETVADVTTIDGFKVIDLPMAAGEASMIVAMPVDPAGPMDLGQGSLEAINEWLNLEERYSTHDVALTLPRFNIEVATSPNEVLKGLGMPTAFDLLAAEFPGIGPGVFIKDIFHMTALEVSEQGTTAAAATKIEFAICFAAGTRVLTPEGTRRIEDIRVGDKVMARDEYHLEGEVEPKLVQATRHGEAEIVELHLGQRRVRTTALHPFFVEGVGWLSAAQLKAGDRLACDRGGSIVVSHVEATGRIEAVYNLSVVDHRTYFVSDDDWGFGVWAHNFCGGTEFVVDRPFHLLIRDNVTDTIAFMGRIEDPTQLVNSVTPEVVVSNASRGDFDNSGVVDQEDYNLWRSTYGQTGAGLQADGNEDGRVDAADYSIWRNNLGLELSPVGESEEPSASSPAAKEQGSPSGVYVPTLRSAFEARSVLESRLPVVADDDDLLLLAAAQADQPVASAPATAFETLGVEESAFSSDQEPAAVGDDPEDWAAVGPAF